MKMIVPILLILFLLTGFEAEDLGGSSVTFPVPDTQETPAGTDEEQTYTVIFVDEDGNPVPEVSAAFCTADKCNYAESDEEGRCVYRGPAEQYHITIVEVPDEFREDFGDDLYTDQYSCSITIVLTRK